VKNDGFLAAPAAGFVSQARGANYQAFAVAAAQEIFVARLQIGKAHIADGSGEILA
jgi:hypothetical protein